MTFLGSHHTEGTKAKLNVALSGENHPFYGWKLIVLWEHEIKSLPEEALLQKIRGKKS